MLQHASGGPVGFGAGVADEVIRGADLYLSSRCARAAVLTAHGNLDGPGEVEDELHDRLVAPDVMVAVEVRREAARQPAKGIDLHAQLDSRLVPVGARRRLARVADEHAFGI